ncbi:MAG: hypothetical protein IJ128_03370 [Firmicutes bacterium]|nr:hypothetical protein [Bacillota bacterium]
MIVVVGSVQAEVRIDMTMPKAPDPKAAQGGDVSPWEREAYGEGGRFGSMQMMPSGDPSKDRISVHYCGCGYNVARLLAEKGRKVAFVSVVGNDPLGLAAAADLQRCGIDTSQVKVIDDFVTKAGQDSEEQVGPDAAGTVANGLIRQSLTSVRVVAKNFLGDTEFWREDRRMLEEITADQIAGARPLLEEAELVLADGGLPEETIRWVASVCADAGVRLYLDPASVKGGSKASELLEGLHGIMPGRMEAEAMSGLQILSGDQLMEAGAYFAEKGVQQIVITMKGGGLYYKEGMKEEILRPDRVLRFSETVGAGDVVTAALLDAYAEGKPIGEAAREAMADAAAYLADCVDERRY